MNIRGLGGEDHVNLRTLFREVPLNPEYHEYDGPPDLKLGRQKTK